MTTGRLTYWAVIVLLVIVITAGSIVIWSRYSQSQPVEISLTPRQELTGEIYIGGAVNNPGYYPFKASDSLGTIIQAAGGTTDGRVQFRLYAAKTGQSEPQKVNLNQAEAWLLQALPGIGETRAQAIIDYRRKNGPFHDTNELMKVEGIGTATYEKIKPLITVAD